MRPFTTSRMITVRLPPPCLPAGIRGSTSFHSSSVRSLGYRNLLSESGHWFQRGHEIQRLNQPNRWVQDRGRSACVCRFRRPYMRPHVHEYAFPRHSHANRPEADAAVEGEKKKRECCRNEESNG